VSGTDCAATEGSPDQFCSADDHDSGGRAKSGALIVAVANGDVTPSEAAELAKLIDGYVKWLEATELTDRVTTLERMIANETAPK